MAFKNYEKIKRKDKTNAIKSNAMNKCVLLTQASKTITRYIKFWTVCVNRRWCTARRFLWATINYGMKTMQNITIWTFFMSGSLIQFEGYICNFKHFKRQKRFVICFGYSAIMNTWNGGKWHSPKLGFAAHVVYLTLHFFYVIIATAKICFLKLFGIFLREDNFYTKVIGQCI